MRTKGSSFAVPPQFTRISWCTQCWTIIQPAL